MQKLGRYDLIRVLGKGAMGLVYEGRDPHLDRRVAIKTIKVENLTDEEAADYEIRFRTEARSAARLQHPHIVTVFDSDRDIDVAYLVMEFIDGDDLKQHMDRGEVYTLAQTLGLMGDLLSALDYAHRQGIVHRDIKPANLLMEPSGRLKLTDFGVARIQDSADATRTQGTMVGTLKYMSPEQVQGLPIDARADLFAAGVVLYQLLTSKRPFDGVSDFDVIQNIINQPPVLPSVITQGLPLALDAVVLKALEKSRDDRYATAQDFHTALAAAVQTGTDQTIAPQAKPASRRSGAMSLGSGLPPFLSTAEGTPGSFTSSSSVVTQEAELVYWKDIKDSSEADDFDEFLRKFPKGIYADLARRKLKRLGTFSNGASGVSSDSGFSGTLVVPRVDGSAGSDDKTVAAHRPELVTEPVKSRSFAMVGAAAAAVVAVVLGAAYFFVSGSPAPSSAQALTVSQPAASQVEVVASAAVFATAAPTPPVATASASKNPLASQPTKPKVTPAPVTGNVKTAAPGATEAAAIVAPSVTCEGRWFLSYQICMSQECSRPELSKLPICLERRAQERSNLERVNGN